MAVNEYLLRHLGVSTPIADTAYVAFNLFWRKHLQRQPQHGTVPLNTTGSSVSSTGVAPSMRSLLLSVVNGAVEIERLGPQEEKLRETRLRFLRDHFLFGLSGDSRVTAETLLDVLTALHAVVLDAFAAALPAVQPNRAGRMPTQVHVREAVASLRVQRQRLEDVLNDINSPSHSEDPDDGDEVLETKLYAACDELYTQLVVPRIRVAEVMLSARAALVLRTKDVCSYVERCLETLLCERDAEGDDGVLAAAATAAFARRSEEPFIAALLCADEETNAEAALPKAEHRAGCQLVLDLLKRDVPRENIDLLDAVPLLLICLTAPHNIAVAQVPKLQRLGLQDADRWVAQHSAAPPIPTAIATSERHRSEEVVVLCDRLESATEAVTNCTLRHHSDALNVLCDAIGQVNLWLRRSGLAIEQTLDLARGKYVPTTTDDVSLYLPHHTDESLGWTRERSTEYEQSCLHYQQERQRHTLRTRLETLLTATDDDFFAACQDDLLQQLFEDCDSCSLINEARQRVASRLNPLLSIRAKIFHYNGEIRAFTMPQTASLQTLRDTIRDWIPNIDSCRISFLEDGDRVTIASEREYRELLKVRRSEAVSGMHQTISAGLSRTTSNVNPSDLKVELYVDLSANATVNVAATVWKRAPLPRRAQYDTKSLPQQYGSQQVVVPKPQVAPQAVHQPQVAPQVVPRPEVTSQPQVTPQAIQQQSAEFERCAKLIEKKAVEYRVAEPPQQLQPQREDPTTRSARKLYDIEHAGPDQVIVYVKERTREGKPPEARAQVEKASPREEAERQASSPNSPPSPPQSKPGQTAFQRHVSDSVLPTVPSGRFMVSRWVVPQHPMELPKTMDDPDAVVKDCRTEGVAVPIERKPSWNRGGDNHVEAVEYNQGSPVQQQPMRYAGPRHRAGVPLPTRKSAGR